MTSEDDPRPFVLSLVSVGTDEERYVRSLLVLLIFVLVKGQTQMGGQRWIPIGPFHLQPSEFGRIGVALLLAMYFGENRRGETERYEAVTAAYGEEIARQVLNEGDAQWLRAVTEVPKAKTQAEDYRRARVASSR